MVVNERLSLGDLARDTISGFTGVIIAKTYWLNGCVRLTVSPKELKDGAPIESHSFDEAQLELVSRAATAIRVTERGGPRPEPRRE